MIQGLPNENRKGGQALWDSKASQTKYGAPGEIRTPDLMVRSHALYPTELRALSFAILPRDARTDAESNGGERGIRTLDGATNPILP